MKEPYHHTGRASNKLNSYLDCPKNGLLKDFLLHYDIELDNIKDWTHKNKFKRIGIEVPLLMQNFVFDLALFLKNQLQIEVIVSGEPCFGACDIKHTGLLASGAEGIIHFGNLEIPNLDYMRLNILFIPLLVKVDISEVLLQAKQRLLNDNIKTIGLVSSIQYVHNISKSKKFFSNNNIQAFAGKGNSRIKSQGQVLGCNVSSAISIKDTVQCFVFLENGNFHAKPVCLATKKDVYCFDPFNLQEKKLDYLELIEKEKEKETNKLKILSKGRRAGVILSDKIGQNRKQAAEQVINILRNNNISSLLINANYLHESIFRSIDVDYYVSTACPRLALDESTIGGKQIINIEEVRSYFHKKNNKIIIDCFDQIN